MVIMQQPFRDDKQIESDLIQCSETLQRSLEQFSQDTVITEHSEIALKINEVINLLDTTVEEIQILKSHISLLHDQVNTLQNKDRNQRIETLRSQSRKNARELRGLLGLNEEISL
ncbi:MAG TPA: hypothetical protein VJ792_08240, partial [Candidatus Nitrosotalea sp.]|nr:hypothetical protein [Candidatus Nitrosotalea sp.]